MEKRTFNQWIEYLAPKIYILGIVVIVCFVGWSFFQIAITQDDTNQIVTASSVYGNALESKISGSGSSWLEVVIKPIVESRVNQIIFKGLFYLLIWVLIFLIVPVAFYKLKRFKLFNLEIEVDRHALQTSLTELLQIHDLKAMLMSNITNDETMSRLFDYLDDNNKINLIGALQEFMNELGSIYKENLRLPLSCEILERNNTCSSDTVNTLIECSLETEQAVICNNKENLIQLNYLVYAFYYDDVLYVTILSSYTTEFSDIDARVVEVYHNVLKTYAETIEFGAEYKSCILS